MADDADEGWGALGRGLELSPLPTFVEATDTGLVVAANPAALHLFGCARSAFVGRAAGPLHHACCDPALHRALLDAARAGGGRTSREAELRRYDGTPVPCRIEVHLLADAAGERALFFLQDLRPIHEAARTRSRAEANLRALVENTRDIIAAYDRDVRLVAFNEACATAYRALLGVELEIGMSTIDRFPEAMRGFWRAANARALAGEVFTIEFEVPAPSGPPAVFESSYNPIREGDEVVGFSTFTRDVTARKRGEEERARFEARLRQTQKMQAVGTLAGGLAHDFNNLLQVVEFSALEALELPELTDPLRSLLTTIVATTERGSELTRRLTRFAHPSEEAKSPVELVSLAREALRLLRRSVATTIAIDLDTSERRVHVLADDAQIEHVMLNLGINAAQAMPDGGRLRVSITSETLDEAAARDLEIAPGDYARLSFADTGHGMDEATLARAFDPFFSTRTRDRNSGLGLTMVQTTVRDHGGAVRARSRPGEGAVFDVHLPRVAFVTPVAGLPAALVATRTGRVLLVDDDPTVLAATEGWLARVGFDVTAFSRSAEALAAYERDPTAWDVVVTDVIMPPPTGTELLRRIVAVRPDARVILVSGYAGGVTAESAKRAGAAAFLSKPVDRAALLRALAGE